MKNRNGLPHFGYFASLHFRIRNAVIPTHATRPDDSGSALATEIVAAACI